MIYSNSMSLLVFNTFYRGLIYTEYRFHVYFIYIKLYMSCGTKNDEAFSCEIDGVLKER